MSIKTRVFTPNDCLKNQLYGNKTLFMSSLRIENKWQLTKWLNDIEKGKSPLKMKMCDLRRNYSYIKNKDNQGYTICGPILALAIDIKTMEDEYAKMPSNTIISADDLLNITKDTYIIYFELKIQDMVEVPMCQDILFRDKKRYVHVDAALDYFKKVNHVILMLLRYCNDFNALSTYIHIRNMEVLPDDYM